MKVEFTVPGEPTAKGRPNFYEDKRTGKRHAVTPAKTVEYENLVKLEYQRQCGRARFPDEAMLAATLTAYYGIPGSASKRRKAAMLAGVLRPTKKPDVDNVIKAVLDALNHLAYRDDVQVVELTFHKLWSDRPRVEVVLEDVNTP